MPVRSLNSSVFRWPNLNEVDAAIRVWAHRQAKRHPEIRRLGYFGSYARKDWGVGSDLDLVAVVAEARETFERRMLSWDLSELPVPAEILIYTQDEWRQLREQGTRFAQTLDQETVWVYPEQKG